MAQSHSLLGASGAARWLACPGSFGLSRSVTPPPPSIYAATGTIAHEIIDECLSRGGDFSMDRSDYLDTTRDVNGVEVTIDSEMLDAVQTMLAYAHGVICDDRLYRTELRVAPRLPFKPPVPVFGSLDLMIVDPKNGWFEIVDYKHGAGVPVKVKNNAQLLYYAAGALAMLEAKAPKGRFKEVVLTVVQPRIPGRNPVQQEIITVLDLELWVAEVLVPGIEAALDPMAEFVPGEHCRFCPGLGSCPALLWKAQAAAKGDFEDYIGQDPDPMRIADQLELADQLEIWMESLRESALQSLLDGEHIPGWRTVPTRATRRWKDEKIVERLLHGQVAPVLTHENALLSPAKMERVIVKTLGQGVWDGIAQTCVEAHSTGVKLARTEQDEFDLLEAVP